MPHLYGLNKDYEWSLMLSTVMAIFVLIDVSDHISGLSIGKQLIIEVAERGKIYADWIARANAKGT